MGERLELPLATSSPVTVPQLYMIYRPAGLTGLVAGGRALPGQHRACRRYRLLPLERSMRLPALFSPQIIHALQTLC